MKTQIKKTEKKAVRKRKGLDMRKSKNIELTILALPVIVFVFIFSYLPMGGVILAFKDYNYVDGIFGSPWIGLRNFEFFFRSDAAFLTTFNTLFYNIVFIVVGTVIYTIVALLLNEVRNRAAIKFYQTVMFLPHFLSWVVVGFILYSFLSPAYGIFNRILIAMGMETQNWYQNPAPWRSILVMSGIWKSLGMSVLISYATLIGIDRCYYEAAEMDGASKFRQVMSISVPFMLPILIIQFILAVGKIFNSDFGLFYQLTQNSGALEQTSSVIETYVFKMLMDSNEIGISAAVGLYQSVVGLVLIIVTNTIVSKVQEDSALF